MIKNFFKTAWRNILRNKAFSFINILGLSTGMAVALLIGLWVANEYSYDRFVPGYADVYKVKMTFTSDGEKHTQDAVSLPLEDVLRKDHPEINSIVETDWGGSHSLIVNDKKLLQFGIMAGAEYFNVFPYPLLQGNAATALKDPYSIVLSEDLASALFGKEDAMNKTVRFDNKHDMKVTAIVKNIPSNSSVWFGYLVPFSYKEIDEPWVKEARTQFTNNSFQLYARLQPAVNAKQFNEKIRDLVDNSSPEMRPAKPEVVLHPMKDWRLFSEFKNGKAVGGFIDYVRMFSLTGILVLLIACINFMNLSTARSEKRAREVGVRKAIGSGRRQLIFQFIAESLLITFFAAMISLLLLQLALPAFNSLTGNSIRVPWSNPETWAVLLGFIFITGLVAGSRPAFYLSSFQPVKVLKGIMKGGRSASLSRKTLVVLQFTCSVALIIGTIIIYRQVQYSKDRPIGYNVNGLLMTEMNDDLNRNYEALRNELLQSGLVTDVAAASSPVSGIYAHTAVHNWPGKTAADEAINIGAIGVTGSYFGTTGMQLMQGRNFNTAWRADSACVILNESAVQRMRLKEPVGQVINWNDHQPVTIVGVVKNAVMESPFAPVEPVIFTHGRGFSSILYRLSAGKGTQAVLTGLAPVFNKHNPAYPFTYDFADKAYERKFNLEVLVGKLAALFAVLAIIISCLGLFGLAAYMAEQRRKEIGIRKVLGASVGRVWLLLSKEFLVLVLISCLIASPIALYFLQGWLEKYDYRITIGAGVFMLAAGMTIVITILTISFQAVRAAIANPVTSLRTE